jgi:hypothetical protein
VRVWLKTRQVDGLVPSKKHFFVDCTVLFSEEEKAIIHARGLGQHYFQIGSNVPPPATWLRPLAALLKAASPLVFLAGCVAGIGMSIAGRGDAVIGFTFFAALGMLLGGIALNRHASVAEKPAQTITLGALINNPSFSVHAVDNATAKAVDLDIRAILEQVKSGLLANAQIEAAEGLRAVKSHFPRWPTGSPDPLVNIISTGILVILGFLALATSLLLLVPIALGFAAIALYRWYHYRQPAYANIPLLTDGIEQRRIAANFPDSATFADNYARRLIEAWRGQLPVLPVLERIVGVSEEIYAMEGLDNPVPPLPVSDPIEDGRYRDFLRIHAEKIRDAPKTLGLFSEAMTHSLTAFRDALPPDALVSSSAMLSEQQWAITVPVLEMLPNVGQLAYDVAIPFYTRELQDLRLFDALKTRLSANDAAASANSSYLPPYEHKGSPREIIDIYLGGTPLADLFEGDLPFTLPDEARFSGHWILSPPGRGKTTLLHAMVMEDIGRTDACVILMDSKGDLIDPIRNLKDIQDRLVIIDPDPQNPIAINPLDIAHADLAQSVDLLEYLFGSLLEFKMTALQTTLFRSVLRALVTAFPEPTLETFRDLLSNGYENYREYIRKLPPDLQDFFYNDFNERTYVDRRREVLQRLRLLLDNETMRAMLLATTTRFRIGEAMDTGKIVIINNSKARLGDQGAEFFGRFFIAQVLAAAQQRSNRSREQKPPVFFYIDECQNVIARDEKIPTILDECRSQNIALIMAHQRTKQIASENVLDALSNCAIRFANSDEEARYLAPRLRTSPQFLQSLGRGRFAAFVRDRTTEAVAVSANRIDFLKYQSLSPADTTALKERMRQDYGVPRSMQPLSAAPSDQPEPEETEDIPNSPIAPEVRNRADVRPPAASSRAVPRAAAARQDKSRPAATSPDKNGGAEGTTDWR